MAPNKIIIDTDPGVDDVLAMLLAFSASPEELDILMLSLTFGNVEVQNCLRNVVTLFHHIEKERAWRKENGRPVGFETLDVRKPIVAVGAEEPLAEHMMVADFFHGVDGLGGIHHSHPHLSPEETWKTLFKPPPNDLAPEDLKALQAVKEKHSLFTPSLKPAHEVMLELLAENEPDTITIVAVGPLTNLAIAAAKDPETFLRVKEVVVMGGAVDAPGNMTPGAEFNTYADSVASARVFALTSANPRLTMPPVLKDNTKQQLPPYPEKLSRRLTLKLFPLDITEPHLLPASLFTKHTTNPAISSSPLTTWTTLFLHSTFAKNASLNPHHDPANHGLQLHDPLTIWYALSAANPKWEFKTEDLRVETSGQWTRGCIVADRRGRPVKEGTGGLDQEVVGDAGGWGDKRRGNRVSWCTRSPGVDVFAGELLERVWGKV
ncbi:Inosine/uridine-preferring nucleoside hydrolase domain-containing protein [Paraphoma chrysanthemicola]|uniref:Inosine/uridine-preferring nucleoside hydrolase domain-containing protein n=1 Tax=Paraphoma chrysanthemicola TaxID=798071 RepID=A0A8K0RIY0_9PLEO|nr:Inosine/uridine-preferring nucleoside hydrolase domain-containing protein [Paraphoma chrysanthemicola]